MGNVQKHNICNKIENGEKDSRKQVRGESYGISNRHFVQDGRGRKSIVLLEGS
jgi:hypothetical protein